MVGDAKVGLGSGMFIELAQKSLKLFTGTRLHPLYFPDPADLDPGLGSQFFSGPGPRGWVPDLIRAQMASPSLFMRTFYGK